MLAGNLPAELKVAPQQQFEKLVGKALTVTGLGGDPSAPAMSKITTAEGKTYSGKSGELKVAKAFYRPQQYAGVEGTFDLLLQELKLGDPDDPNNKGDQPIGDPVKSTGSFTAKALAYPYESL